MFVLSCLFCLQPARGHITTVITARHSLLLRHRPVWVSEHRPPPLKHSTPHTSVSMERGLLGIRAFPLPLPTCSFTTAVPHPRHRTQNLDSSPETAETTQQHPSEPEVAFTQQGDKSRPGQADPAKMRL